MLIYLGWVWKRFAVVVILLLGNIGIIYLVLGIGWHCEWALLQRNLFIPITFLLFMFCQYKQYIYILANLQFYTLHLF